MGTDENSLRLERFTAVNERQSEVPGKSSLGVQRFAEMWSAISEITPFFDRPWKDLGWYAENHGLKPWDYVILSDLDDVTVMYDRSGPFQLLSQSYPVFKFFGDLSETEISTFTLYCDEGWTQLELGRTYPGVEGPKVFSSAQRRQIVEAIAVHADPAECSHEFYTPGDVGFQVTRPEPWEDFAAFRAATGPRWNISLGWFTYIDTRSKSPIPTGVSWPEFVTVRPFHHGVTIQMGDDAYSLSPAMIAEVRKALGWEYIADDLK